MSVEIEVRSFRSVFALERRIYRIDTLRLNPGGIPLRGIGYAAALIVAALIAGATPPTAWLDPFVPWYVRDVGAPLATAVALGAIRVDGRPFHSAAGSLVEHTLAPRSLNALTPQCRSRARWRPPSVLLLPDGSDPGFRRFRYRGPGAVLVSRPHVLMERRRCRRADVTLHPLPGGAGNVQVIELADGGLLDVRPR
ncbi:MAG TPA: hypothetical protein VID68_08030 [Solirubrobacteraceae bacterium]|jgi:hypothetical protein